MLLIPLLSGTNDANNTSTFHRTCHRIRFPMLLESLSNGHESPGWFSKEVLITPFPGVTVALAQVHRYKGSYRSVQLECDCWTDWIE